jgi:DNA-binding MarR family transcriptional regulator
VAEALYALLPYLVRHAVAEARQVPGCSGLTIFQLRVMGRLSEREYRAGELADAVGVGRPTLTAITDSLVRRGLVRRAQDVPGDRRAVTLGLTDAGCATFEQVRARSIKTLAKLLPEMAHADAAVLLRALTGIRGRLEASRG